MMQYCLCRSTNKRVLEGAQVRYQLCWPAIDLRRQSERDLRTILVFRARWLRSSVTILTGLHAMYAKYKC